MQDTQPLQLAIIIVNFRKLKLVIGCLRTLLPELDDLNARVVVVDNRSPDDSPEMIQLWLAQQDTAGKVLFIRSEHNGGFASGNNIGIKSLKAGWTIVHNPEARVVHLLGGNLAVKKQTKLKKRIPKYFYESRAKYYCQAYGWMGLMAANILWWMGRTASRTRQMLGQSERAAIKGQWLDIWTNWLSPLKRLTLPES